jgi:hypothetical protein
LAEAIAQLLEVEHAAGLIHPLARPLDGRQERQDAGEEDAGGHGEIGPTERDPHRHVIGDRPRSPPIARDEGHGALRQIGGVLEGRPVIEQPVHRLPESLDPGRLLVIIAEGTLEPLALGAVHLAQDIIDHLIGFHGVIHPRRA